MNFGKRTFRYASKDIEVFALFIVLMINYDETGATAVRSVHIPREVSTKLLLRRRTRRRVRHLDLMVLSIFWGCVNLGAHPGQKMAG